MSLLIHDLRFLRSKMSRGNLVELAWVFGGQAVTLLMGFVILKLLTQMGTAAFGEYTLTLTISALLGQVIYGPVEQGFIRYYYYYVELGHAAHLVRLLYRFLVWSGACIGVVTLIFSSGAMLLGQGSLGWLGLTAGAFIVAQKGDEFFNTALNIIRRRKENYLLQGAHKVAAGLVLLLLYRAGRLQLVPVMVGLTAVTCLAVLVKYLNYDKHIPRASEEAGNEPAGRGEMAATLRGYALPFMLWGVTGWMQLNGEKWILADRLSVSEVGVYAVMLSVINLLLIIPNNMMVEYISPIIFRHYADLDREAEMRVGHRYIRLTVAVVFALTVAAATVASFAGAPIIRLISSREYATYAHLLPMLTVGTGLFFAGQAMCNLGMALNRPAAYLAPKVFAGLLSVAVNYLLIWRLGVEGIAYAAITVGGVYLVHVAYVNRGILRELRERRGAVAPPLEEAP